MDGENAPGGRVILCHGPVAAARGSAEKSRFAPTQRRATNGRTNKTALRSNPHPTSEKKQFSSI